MGRIWIGLCVALAACRGPSAAPWGDDAASEAGAESAPAASRAAPSTNDDPPQGGASATAPGTQQPSVGENAGAAGATVAEGCGAQAVTLAEIHSGRVRSGIAVSVGPLVASSQKFLVSEAKSGSCLWGAFAADPLVTGAGSGLFLVSFGAPHAEGEACAPGADGLPGDLSPGDGLQVEGKLEDYVPAACAGTAPAPQLLIDAACPARREGGRTAPTPASIDFALATRLAAGIDAELLRDWSGALVRVEAASAVQDADDGDAVFPFGVLRLAETSLEVHSRLYYFDLSEGGPRASVKAPHYAYPTVFRSITGIVFLDYCSWVLAPRDRCADLSPSSAGCLSLDRR
jgi:hypothetical protein